MATTMPLKIKGTLTGIQFGLESSNDIITQSVCEVSNTKLSGPSSVYDERMGVLENGKLCVTCNKNNKECVGHFGHIRLNVSVAHPLYYKSILGILRCVCYRCSRIRMSKEQLEFHGLLKHEKQARYTKVLKLLEKVDACFLCHALQPKYTLSITDKTIVMSFKVDGEVQRSTLYDHEIRKIFENMIDTDVALLGFDPVHSHPKSLILEVLPVLPPVARPYILSDNVTCDDDLTIQYLEIIKANAHLHLDNEDAKNVQETKRQRYIQSLKFRIKCLFDNSQERSKHSNGRPLKGIKKRLTGKEGQLRNNLMGKRVDKSARTVIGPDPTLRVDEIAIPYEIAETLTYPEKVTALNIERLTTLLSQHKINYVIRKGSSQRINMKYALHRQRSRLQFGDYIQKPDGRLVFVRNEKQFFHLQPHDRVIRDGRIVEDFEHAIPKFFVLEMGDVVERKLQDGDVLLLNRQPTLHKGSMMAFKVRIRSGKTIRMNLAITKSFNADFDGDEMNLHAPNSVETETELRLLSSVQNHIISPQSSKPNIVIVQDGLLGAYLVSGHYEAIPYATFLNIIHGVDQEIDWTSILQRKRHQFQQRCPSIPVYSGKLLISLLLPDDFVYDDGDVVIRHGILTKGRFTKKHLGSHHQSLIAKFYHLYSVDECQTFINRVQFLSNEFLKYNGFSVGLQDCIIPKTAEEMMDRSIQKHFVETQVMYDTIRTPHLLEMSVANVLNNTRNTCMRIAKEHLSSTNRFKDTVTSGSKGDYFNIMQIMAMLGPQNFQGQRIQPTLSNHQRTLPHFPLHPITDPMSKFQAQGFIRGSFLKGLDPTEFWFHSITGREGITDTAMKSVTWETPIIILEDGHCRYVRIGEWIDARMHQSPSNVRIVRHDQSSTTITDNVHHPHQMDEQMNEVMEVMEVMEVRDVYIPTTSENGNVSWSPITMLTRHDPGKQLYRIQTRSGRSVIVTESKSLLVYNPNTHRLEEIRTPDVRVGHLVPITLKLLPPSSSSSSTNTQFSSVEMGMKMGMKMGMDERFVCAYLVYGTVVHNHTIRFILPSNTPKWVEEVVLTFFHHHSLKHDVKSTGESKSVVLTARSIKMATMLQTMMGSSDRNRHLPSYLLLTLNDDFVHTFVKILLSLWSKKDGNGIVLSSMSKRWVDETQFIMTRFGIHGVMRFVTLSNHQQVVRIHSLHIQHENYRLVCQLGLIAKSEPSNNETDCRPSQKTMNDVLLDEIVEMELVDIRAHPKVYDLTVPETLNFGLANGLQVRDTATSGYIQRRMVKVAEDVQVKYDDTVRNSAGNILQYRYGNNSYDPSHSVIIKNPEGELTPFFADVDGIVDQMNARVENECV